MKKRLGDRITLKKIRQEDLVPLPSPFVGDELGVDEVDPKDIRNQDDCVLFLAHLPFSFAFVSGGRKRDVCAEAVLYGDGAEGVSGVDI